VQNADPQFVALAFKPLQAFLIETSGARVISLCSCYVPNLFSAAASLHASPMACASSDELLSHLVASSKSPCSMASSAEASR
jgi:hypothetical protein